MTPEKPPSRKVLSLVGQKPPSRKVVPLTGQKPPSRKAAPRGADDRERLATRIADALGISREEAELRALRELAERIAPEKPAAVDLLHVRSEKARRTRASRPKK
jgi:hypothetical protein